MNKPSEQTPTIGPAKSGDVTQPGKGAPRQDPKETAQEAVHQVTPRDKADTGKSYNPSPAQNMKSPPLHAAKGNDEVMSQPSGKQT